MKFSRKFPECKPGEFTSTDIVLRSKNGETGQCDCGEFTEFIDVDFQCWMCSEECQQKLCDEYNEASR
jgi:hypothetical protein